MTLQDDAAHMNMGGAWYMPTREQFQELLDECDWEWSNKNGINGYIVTSTAQDNTNYIFLPATGYRYSSYLNNAGQRGHYWSSSLISGYSRFACNLVSSSLYFDGSREIGRTVRGVCTPK